jgi:hypothetical protein
MHRAWVVAPLLSSLVACSAHKDSASRAGASSTSSTAKSSRSSVHSTATASESGEVAAPPRKKPPRAKAKNRHEGPTLPSVAKQKKHKPGAGNVQAASRDYPCGSVKVGGDEIPLECVDPDLASGNEESRVIIPYDLMPTRSEALPKGVDHRDGDMEAPTRAQGHVGSCTAFATTNAIDHAYALWTGKVEPISVLQVWAEYHRGSQNAANASIMGRAFAPESAWPYDAKLAKSWSPLDKCNGDRKECGKPVDGAKLEELEKKGIVTVDQIERLWHRSKTDPKFRVDKDMPTELFKAKIAAGADLIISVTLPKGRFEGLEASDDAGAVYIPDDVEAPDQGGGHMMSLVGYETVDDGTYFLLKNSWGPKWGQGGYAWIHDVTLSKIIGNAFALDAEPLATTGLRRPTTAAGASDACKADEVADVVSGACVKPCEDGSPPTDGACGETEGCPEGDVNLTGECVLAAPKVSGKDPKSLVAFACAPGGCSYSLPRGFEGCSGTCKKSCPAPYFRLAKGPKGLTCVE